MYSVESNATSSPRVESAHSVTTDEMVRFVGGNIPCGERTVFALEYALSMQHPAESLVAALHLHRHMLPSLSIG